MKKILHITNWYPNKWNDLEALFVKEQFKLFSEVSSATLLHVQIREGSSWFKYEKIRYSENEMGYYILTSIKIYRIIEILSTLLLFWALFRSNAKKFDLLHFHIAYPLLTYYHLWKKVMHIPVIISEHWSAYHFNFFMPKETKKLNRIKNIFYQDLPVITVSKALLNDIQVFSQTKSFPTYIIPNVIDLEIYNYKAQDRLNPIPQFFIVNLWRAIKNPYPMLEAFGILADNDVDFKLNIGGYGPILNDMKQFVKEHGLNEKVTFLGKMYKEEIAKEMHEADAYLFSSEYETFSAVCAQSLSCGCPLIGPAIPAILEYASEGGIILLKENNVEGWKVALKSSLNRDIHFNHRKIAQRAEEFLSHTKIQEQYKTVINDQINT